MATVESRMIAFLQSAAKEVVKEQIAVARIPCMNERAAERAAYLAKAFAAANLTPRRDKVGNVIAMRAGAAPRTRPTLVVSAHLDSVFLGLSPIRVQRKGRVLRAPGICDDAAGVADMILLARAMARFDVTTAGDVVFVGSTGEEGAEGVWGMEHFWKESRLRKPFFLGIDGAIPGRIVARSLGTWTATVTVRGPGGHTYISFGRPNPVHVVSRLVAKVTSVKADRAKDAAYNANVISGGTSYNVIPTEASVTINIRSSDAKTLKAMKAKVVEFLKEARREELAWASSEKRIFGRANLAWAARGQHARGSSACGGRREGASGRGPQAPLHGVLDRRQRSARRGGPRDNGLGRRERRKPS